MLSDYLRLIQVSKIVRQAKLFLTTNVTTLLSQWRLRVVLIIFYIIHRHDVDACFTRKNIIFHQQMILISLFTYPYSSMAGYLRSLFKIKQPAEIINRLFHISGHQNANTLMLIQAQLMSSVAAVRRFQNNVSMD